jgi:hypothetical protein
MVCDKFDIVHSFDASSSSMRLTIVTDNFPCAALTEVLTHRTRLTSAWEIVVLVHKGNVNISPLYEVRPMLTVSVSLRFAHSHVLCLPRGWYLLAGVLHKSDDNTQLMSAS